jgi:hypothetical protein
MCTPLLLHEASSPASTKEARSVRKRSKAMGLLRDIIFILPLTTQSIFYCAWVYAATDQSLLVSFRFGQRLSSLGKAKKDNSMTCESLGTVKATG